VNEPTREELLGIIVQQAAIAAEGSFAQRNPTLGKMKNCPYCGRRRRETEVCCNPIQLVTVKNDVPRSFYAKKRKIPRLTKNRPPLFEMHAILLDKERQPGYKEIEGISGIVEAQIMRRRRAKTKVRRDQQRKSRKANRSRR
jgi:hypothetical protein